MPVPPTPHTHPSPAADATFEAADRLWNLGSVEGLFTSPQRVVPWKSAPRSKHRPLLTDDDKRRLCTGPPAIADLDPRYMFATQTFCIAPHVAHYLTDIWETTGRTSANPGTSLNRWPLVWIDEKGHQILLGGHHRSMAALIQGRSVRCRVVRQHGDETRAVLPRLLVGATTGIDHHRTTDPTHASSLIRSGATVLVPDFGIAEATLIAMDQRDDVIADRLHMADVGRCRMVA